MKEMIGKAIYTLTLWIGLGVFSLSIGVGMKNDDGISIIYFFLFVVGTIGSFFIFLYGKENKKETEEKSGS